MNSASSTPIVPPSWRAALGAGGFVPEGAVFQQNGLVFRPTEHWLVWETSLPEAGFDACAFGRPGLWRPSTRDVAVGLCFEVPAKAVAQAEAADADDGAPGLPAFLEWARASVRGRLPAGWRPPPREEVLGWLPPEPLTWRGGPFVRQGELLLGPERWGFRFPILPRLPDDLPPVREQFLQILCRDALARWRMVRVGVSAVEDGRALIAEVDLSGAPAVAPLVLASLESLKYVVGWLVEAAVLLADVRVTLRVLEIAGLQTPKERTEP
jgi:hypothetical protein